MEPPFDGKDADFLRALRISADGRLRVYDRTKRKHVVVTEDEARNPALLIRVLEAGSGE